METNHYLILEFKDAKLFRNNRGTKDKIIDQWDKESGKDRTQNFKEPITIYQVSNLLHVIFGDRPVPTLRRSLHKRNDYIFEKAKDSFIRITTPFNLNDSNEKEYIGEVTQIKKCLWNSWSKTSVINWFKVRLLLEEPLYTYFINELNTVFNLDVTKLPLTEVRTMINNHSTDYRIEILMGVLIKKLKTPLVEYINNNVGTFFNMNPRTSRLVNRGIDKIVKFNGQIIVPLTDEDLERVKLSIGSATLLDGGMVYIKDILDPEQVNVENFIKISELSNELIKTK